MRHAWINYAIISYNFGICVGSSSRNKEKGSGRQAGVSKKGSWQQRQWKRRIDERKSNAAGIYIMHGWGGLAEQGVQKEEGSNM